MKRKAVSGVMLTILLATMSTLVFNVSHVRADGSWVWVMDTVTGAYGEAVVGTGKALYIARGTSLYRYLPADDSWVELASPPEPDGSAFKTGTALAWDFGEYIYALCGAATDDSRRWFYRYSISSNSWETLANTTADQGEGNAITWVSIDNGIYATIGGEQRPTYFMRYDPSTNSWSDAPADPPAGMGDGASLVWTGGDYLFALRGEFLESSPLYDFWRYSLTDNAWTAMADIPALPHSGGTGGVGDGGSLLYAEFWLSSYTDYIYALSGNQAHPDGIPDNRTYRYTISTNSWERLADLPFGVGYYVGCHLGYADGHIYAWQGAPSTWTGGGDDLAKYRLAWIVDDDGPADFHTIQEAINAASPGDTVFVKAGTYYENVVVNKNVWLVGENPSTTVIDGGGIGNVLDITANNISIQNFTIRNGYGPWNGGINIENYNGALLKNNKITNNRFGIILYNSANNEFSGNNFAGNEYGIIAGVNCSNNIISGNDFSNNKYSALEFSDHSNNNLISGNTIINNTYPTFFRNSLSNVISRNNMMNNSRGIQLYYSNNNIVSENNITAPSPIYMEGYTDGICLLSSSNNIIYKNIVANSGFGIELEGSSNCTFSENKMNSNTYNLGVFGSVLSDFMHSIDVSNLVDGKPVYYLINQTNIAVNPTTHPQVGYLALVNSINVTVEGLTLTNNWQGILLAYTDNSTIRDNNLTENEWGVYLRYSSNNKLCRNNLANNYYGIGLVDSSNNFVYHNNFINNIYHAISYEGSVTVWDDGYPSGGNYWSGIGGADLFSGSHQNETGSDGIRDTGYFTWYAQDQYPLMAPFNVFDVGTWNGLPYNVDVVSNSTVSAFYFNPDEGAFFRFNVTGESGTVGFCRVTIPRSLLWVEDGWTITVGDQIITDYTIIPDEDYTYLYFTYTHASTKTVLIQGTHVIPEFSPAIILPLFMVLTMLAIVFTKSKIPRRQKI